MANTDINLIQQGKGSGSDANKFLRSDGSGGFTMARVTLANLDYTGLTTNTLPKYNGTSFVNSRITDNGTLITIGTSASRIILDNFDEGSITLNQSNQNIVLTSFVDGPLVVQAETMAPLNITGLLAFMLDPTSAKFATLVTDEVGTSKVLFNQSITAISFRDTSAAFDVNLGFTSGTALTANRTLTIDMVNADRTIRFVGTTGITTFPSASSTLARTDTGQTFTGQNIFNNTSTGTITISSNTTSTDPLLLTVSVTGTGAKGQLASFFASQLANGDRLFYALGKVWSSGNSTYFAYTRDATATNCRGSIGHWGADDIINIWASGGVSVDGKISGSFAGVDPGDKNFVVKNGNLGIGVTTWGTSAVKVFGIGNGTEPSTSPADMIQLYSVDESAGNATLGIRTEIAVVSEVVVSDRTVKVKWNGTIIKLCCKS